VLKLFREDGLKIIVPLINNLYETGERPKDFTNVTMIALKKTPKAIKSSDHRTISLITHTAEIVLRIPRRRMKGKPRMHLEKISLDLEEEKELQMQSGC
jgi:hypothetical protein